MAHAFFHPEHRLKHEPSDVAPSPAEFVTDSAQVAASYAMKLEKNSCLKSLFVFQDFKIEIKFSSGLLFKVPASADTSCRPDLRSPSVSLFKLHALSTLHLNLRF